MHTVPEPLQKGVCDTAKAFTSAMSGTVLKNCIAGHPLVKTMSGVTGVLPTQYNVSLCSRFRAQVLPHEEYNFAFRLEKMEVTAGCDLPPSDDRLLASIGFPQVIRASSSSSDMITSAPPLPIYLTVLSKWRHWSQDSTHPHLQVMVRWRR